MKQKQTKNCIVCNQVYEKPYYTSQKQWEKRINCSMACQSKFWTGRKDGRKRTGSKNSMPAWNKGISPSQATLDKMSESMKIVAKEKGFGLWMTGKKDSINTRFNKSKAQEERIERSEHNWYIDGRTPQNEVIRHSIEYRLWREAVFKRDNYTCQFCGIRSAKGVKVYLHADHIKLFSEFPELRTSIANGRTLCRECHYQRHSKIKTDGNFSHSRCIRQSASSDRQ